jgi:hypothetical protein
LARGHRSQLDLPYEWSISQACRPARSPPGVRRARGRPQA